MTLTDEEPDPFTQCEDLAEVVVLVNKAHGLEGVERLLKSCDATREALREAADVLHAIGMQPLASLARLHARRAQPALMPFAKRHRTQERRNGTLPGYRKHRYV